MSAARGLGQRLGIVALLGVCVASCGARTGLEAPEPPPPCTPGVMALAPRAIDVLLVVDRSQSMLERMPLPGLPEARRWDLMSQTIERTTNLLEQRANVGAMFFPRDPERHICDPDNLTMCAVDLEVSIPARPRNGSRIMGMVRAHNPDGGSPLFAALQVARRWLRSNATPGSVRGLVLLSDGGVNCNLDTEFGRDGCECEDRDPVIIGPSPCEGSSALKHFYCIDDQRSSGMMRGMPDAGIEAFVVAVMPEGLTREEGRLETFAREGGRPRAGRRGYYRTNEVEEITEALRTQAQCQWTIPRDASWSGAEPELTLGGRPFPRDPRHVSGWDWVDRNQRSIRIYGTRCTEGPEVAPTFERVCSVE